MWKVHTQRQGRCLLNIAKRKLSSEAAPPKPSPPPPTPPEPKAGGFGFFKLLGITLPLAGSGVIGYAWYDPDFRKQLESNVPYAKEALTAILPVSEQKTPQALKQPPKAIGNLPAFDVPKEGLPQLRSKDEGLNSQQAKEKTPRSTNVFEMIDDPEKRLTEEILAYKSNPLHSLTAPDIAPQQSYNLIQLGDVNLDHAKSRNMEAPDSATHQSYLPQLKDGYIEQSGSPDMEAPDIVTQQSDNLHQLKDGNMDQSKIPYVEEITAKVEPKTPSIEKARVQSEKGVSKPVDKKVIDDQLKKMEEEEKADNAALDVIIHKYLSNSETLSEEAIRAQQDYASAVRNHTQLLRQAMDDTSDILQKDAQWEAVSIAYSEREYAKERANDLVAESKRTIEKLREELNKGKANSATKQNPAIVPASKKVNEILKDINASSAQIRQAEAEANVMLKYKDLVDKGKKQFQKEIESLLPDVKIGSGKKLTEDELNALIAHAHRRIEQLQRQIAEHIAMERQRVNVALEAQRQEDARLTNSAVLDERSRLNQEFDVEQQKMEMEYLVKLEAEVRKQLARQAAAHSDHIKDVLAIQQEQLGQEFNRELNAKLLEEREKFQTEVAGWISRLKGIEAAVDARANSEKLARSAQDLWLACIALNSVLLFGFENESDDKKQVPLRSKVEAILNSGLKHPFVETVANAIPAQALDEGVSTEEELRTRFSKVARICRRLGLVQDPSSSLYKYIVSYFHSFLVLDNIKAEGEKDEVDLSLLDNYDLIAYAQYWMEKGNFELALKFMCQLTGESKRAASDWIDAARLLLETKQCASTLTAFASATGLANTF